MRRLSVLTLTLTVALMIATACGSNPYNPMTAAPSSPAVATGMAPANTLVATTVEETAVSAAPDADVCAAATEESLLAALRSSPDFNSRVAHPTGFGHIQCSAPFAVGWTTGTVQGSGVLFRRDGSGWSVLDVGSAMHCAKYGVTTDDALEGCVV